MKEISREKFEKVNKFYDFSITFFITLFMALFVVCILSFNLTICIASFIGMLMFASGAIGMEIDKNNWRDKYANQYKN